MPETRRRGKLVVKAGTSLPYLTLPYRTLPYSLPLTSLTQEKEAQRKNNPWQKGSRGTHSP
eukprot:9836021-Prorocentrum_lima.AAC.1